MWTKDLRLAGYDPKLVKDAHDSIELGVIERCDLKGAVIGSPLQCCGARHIIREGKAEWAWVGANVAIIAFTKKRIRRYLHNGGVPSMQDKGFFPLGVAVRLKRPHRGATLAEKRNHGPTKKRAEQIPQRKPSIVGEFRRKS